MSPAPKPAMASLTKAVVAICVEFVPATAVGAVGDDHPGRLIGELSHVPAVAHGRKIPMVIVPYVFEVEEIPVERPEGDGEHLYLWLEKRGLTTTAVARALAERAGVDSGEVGFAGRKDRWAVTRQWFSVPRWPVERAAELASALASGPASELATPGVEILDAVRGRRRLRLGELAGNRFRLRVRGLSTELLAAALAAFETLARRGFANAFGRQRFGSRGDNVDRGLGVLAGDDRTGGRRRRAFLISAVQAEVFNRVLARRPVGWDELMTGDLAVAHGSGRLVAVADPAELAPRLERFAVSATGPIFGAKMPRAGGAVAELEAAGRRRR